MKYIIYFYYLLNKPIPLLVLFVIYTIALYRIFEKAGIKGYKAIIPIYNFYLLNKLSFGKGLYMFLILIPYVNVIYCIAFTLKLALCFNKNILFGICMFFLFPIFFCILGFDKSKYVGEKKIFTKHN